MDKIKKKLKAFNPMFILIIAIWLSFLTGGCAKIQYLSSEGQTEMEEKQSKPPETGESQSRLPETGESQSTADSDIPWGFDAASYQLYKSGALDLFIPSGSEADQCVIADLNMDGVDDVILSVITQDTTEQDDPSDYIYWKVDTLILKGCGENTFQLAAENKKANYYDGNSCGYITAGDGWFKLTTARGTGVTYVYSALFQYDKEKKDWFLAAYYNNSGGYTVWGCSELYTPDNFGSISFEDYNNFPDEAAGKTEGSESQEDLSVEEDGFKVLAGGPSVMLEDKEKEHRINNLINNDIESIIDGLRGLNKNVDIWLNTQVTYETPQIISIEYGIRGAIGEDEYSRINQKYITAVFDIEQEKKIRLSDIIDVNELYQAIKKKGVFGDEGTDNANATKRNIMSMEKEKRLELLKTSDDLNTPFGPENTGIYSAVYERSLCIYFQPELFGMGPYCESPKIFIPIEDILPYVKLDYWDLPENETTHIEWLG